jgi:hypothetical protein
MMVRAKPIKRVSFHPGKTAALPALGCVPGSAVPAANKVEYRLDDRLRGEFKVQKENFTANWMILG